MKHIYYLVAASISLSSLGSAQVLVNDDFSDGDRTTQNPPSSLAWYSSAATSNLTVDSGALVNNTPATARGATSYFTTLGNSKTLAIGEQIDITFDFTATDLITGGFAANALNVGLFDSAGLASNRINGDGQNPTDIASEGYAGRLTFSSSSGGSQRVLISKRDLGTGALITNNDGYSLLENGVYSTDLLTQDVTYNAKFSIGRTSATESQLTMSIFGGDLTEALSVSTTDSSGVIVSFDTLALSSYQNGTSAGIGNVAFDNVNVAVIPEPSSFSFIALAVVAAFMKRNVRSRSA